MLMFVFLSVLYVFEVRNDVLMVYDLLSRVILSGCVICLVRMYSRLFMLIFL